MMKRTEHLYAGFREHATYHFLLRTTGMIELNNRLGHQKTLGLNGRQHEFYKFRNWIVVSRYRNLTCELTLRYNIAWTRTLPVPAQYERAASQLPPGFLEINFQAGMIDLESRIDGGPEWTAENVSSLEITPNQKITVVSDLSQTFRPVSEPYQTGDRQASCSPRAMSETAQGLLFRIFQPNDRQEESGNGFRIMPQSAPQPETPSSPDAAEQRQSAQVQQEWKTAQTERNHAPEDFARIRDTLNQVQQELEQTRDERNQARKDLAQMREQFEREQRRNAQLQTSLSGSLEQLAERLRPDLEHLNAALQEKTRAVETRTAELEALSRDVKTLDSDLKSLETQIEELNRLKEIRSMDCQQAREELDALRMQYQDDDESLTLLQENASHFLRNSTLRTTMNRIVEELDAAEQQIGRIIRWRESVNGAVQRTVLDGNGLLNFNSELKG